MLPTITPLAVWRWFLVLMLLPFSVQGKDSSDTLRVGVLEFGTVRWELDVIERHKLASKYKLKVNVVPLASNQATLTALQSGSVDVIVGDWIWAARQREFGRQYRFYPYSTMAASVIVTPESGIKTFTDLRQKRIGIAGGPVNKSWILYRAYARKVHNMDLIRESSVKLAAPPILNQLLLNHDLDAVINFWHFSSRLEAAGMPELVNMSELLTSLDVDPQVPLLGWLFKSEWAQVNEDMLTRFLQLSYEARDLMKTSDVEWQQITPVLKEGNAGLQARLRDAYRQGIPARFGDHEIAETQKLFRILRAEAGSDLAGQLEVLPDDLFWRSKVLSGE